MAQMTLYQILDQLPTLEPEELRQLNQAVQAQLMPQEEDQKRTTFHQALLASGLVKQLKPPRHDEDTQRRLIEVQGKPVSETILEERR
jgi:hypothetical protein